MNKPSESLSCRPQWLTLYYYGELEGDDRLWVENHLQGCAVCRRELVELESALDALPKGETAFSPGEIRAFDERVCRRIRPGHRLPVRPALGWTLAAATAVLLMVVLHAPTPVPQQPPSEVALQRAGEAGRLPDAEMLLNLELLENLDLLQELEGTGSSG